MEKGEIGTAGKGGTARAKRNVVKMVHEWHTDSPVMSACVMADGIHVCTGSFNGSVSMWDVQVFSLLPSVSLLFLHRISRDERVRDGAWNSRVLGFF